MSELKVSSLDNELAEFKNGNTQCFLRYFHEHYAYFLHFITSGYKWDPLTSKRITITIFSSLWRKRSDFDTWGNINAFLYLTCRRESVNFLRHLSANPGDQYKIDQKLLSQLPDDIHFAFRNELGK